MSTTATLTASPASPSSVIVANPPPPPKVNVSYRLLYRGALSLPDSEIFLEGIATGAIRTYMLTLFHLYTGITFVANLPCKSSGPLISSPIPLALESMRGRSALRLVGVVKTMDVRLEVSDEVSMYVLAFVLPKLHTHRWGWLKQLDACRDFSIAVL